MRSKMGLENLNLLKYAGNPDVAAANLLRMTDNFVLRPEYARTTAALGRIGPGLLGSIRPCELHDSAQNSSHALRWRQAPMVVP